jgi:hypothetical protein
MIRASCLLLALVASSATGMPLTKRIAQVISASTTKWEAACNAAGGGEQCNPVAVAAFSTLLAAAGPCDQQNAADNMINLAHSLNSDPTMIQFTQIFVQQPRNTPSSLSVPYCQQAPNNTELTGLFQCQYKGANPTTFVGNVPVGQPGTIPFGQSAALSPPGSCPANPTGPIDDGTQLTDITSDPGLQNAKGAAPPASAPSPSASPDSTPTDPAPTDPAASPDATPDATPDPYGMTNGTMSPTASPSGTATPTDAAADPTPTDTPDCGTPAPADPTDTPAADTAATDTPAPGTPTPTPTSNAPAPTSTLGPQNGAVVPPACAAKQKRAVSFTFRTPIAKRIAQADLPAVAQSWQNLCLVSGGDIKTNDPCVNLAGINGINALLAGADPCAQQDNADAMIDFANSAGITNKDALIANAVAYRKHPRNALDLGGFVPSTPFCTRAPKNSQLNGLVNGQLNGVNPGLFGGPKFPVVAFGAPGTCPFGQTPNVNTCTCS